MIIRNKPTISIYDNLLRDSIKINAWNIYECFPFNPDFDQDSLDNLNVIEISSEGTHGDNNLYYSVLNNHITFLKQYLFSKSIDKYIFLYSLSERKQKSRIRSYKGIFPRSLDPKDYVEMEFDLNNNNSFIVGMAKVSFSNFDSLYNLLFNRCNNLLMLTSNKDYFTSESLKNMTNRIVDNRKGVINYINLFKLYSNENIFIREAGDGGDQELSWQFFIDKTNSNDILLRIKSTINSLQ